MGKPLDGFGDSIVGFTSGTPGGVSTPSDDLANIAELIDDGGQISIGGVRPIPCAAVANDDHDCLAMLQRRRGETFHQLLKRLNAAIGSARDSGIRIDEITQRVLPRHLSDQHTKF